MMKIMYIEILEKMMMFMLVVIMGMISVSFLTLFERKLLGYIQIRKGPNKVGMNGIIQPFSDAMKLLTKELIELSKINLWYYYMCPFMMMVMSMMLWLCLDYLNYINNIMFMMLLMLSCMSMSSYFIMISGWSSNSIYSLLGSIRSVAQVISYEVSMIFILMSMMMMMENFFIYKMENFQSFFFIVYMYPLSIMFLISILAELNRTPFDLIEGESELVSGFNVEYFSSGFTLIFLSEYLNIMFMSMIFVSLYMKINLIELYIMFLMLMVYMILSIRGVLPRMRYDKLMMFCWLKMLPISMNYLIYISCMKFLLF